MGAGRKGANLSKMRGNIYVQNCFSTIENSSRAQQYNILLHKDGINGLIS